jgi:hypothetical protein
VTPDQIVRLICFCLASLLLVVAVISALVKAFS